MRDGETQEAPELELGAGSLDTDLARDPKYLPDFFRELAAGADIRIGSRNVPGGNTVGRGMRRDSFRIEMTYRALRLGLKEQCRSWSRIGNWGRLKWTAKS